jgi:hypothetical protein
MRTMLEPEKLVAVLGAVYMGALPDGSLAVEITTSKAAEMFDLRAKFNRAAAAFMREFAKGEELVETERIAAQGVPRSKEMDEVHRELSTAETKYTETIVKGDEKHGPTTA